MKPYWPRHLPRDLVAPDTTIDSTLDISVARFPNRTAIFSFGREISYRELSDFVARFAGWLTGVAGVRAGDRVILYMQNSAQWVIAYYATLRAAAIVVPINPMNRSVELKHYLHDSGATVVVCANDLVDQIDSASSGTALKHIVVATYADYIPDDSKYLLPSWLLERSPPHKHHTSWKEVMDADMRPPELITQPDDICVLPYTSGSTGVPRACMHSHRSFMHNMAGMALWHWTAPGTAFLCVAPMYHVAGLSHSLHLPIYVGGTLVILPRWERELALRLMSDQRVGHAAIPPTAVIDMLSHAELERFDLSGLRRITAGGASMPIEVWRRLKERLDLDFIEGYGMTETAATTHNNPIDKPKRQCLGVPFFNTRSIVVDPATLSVVPVGQEGEILVCGPQVFKGYWGQPEATEAAFVEVDGVRYLRTGDIGRVDEDGYFYLTDRAKRMINASGYKVWPAEVESVLYRHPEVKEVCVIGTVDSYRGETVKALVVRREDSQLSAESLTQWARHEMAAYKYPRVIEFVSELPKSPVGKILWRDLQELEDKRKQLVVQ